MILVKPSFEITAIMGDLNLKDIEKAGRTCYKSESSITNDSAREFVRRIIERGHESVIEHSAMTVRIICDRGA